MERGTPSRSVFLFDSGEVNASEGPPARIVYFAGGLCLGSGVELESGLAALGSALYALIRTDLAQVLESVATPT